MNRAVARRAVSALPVVVVAGLSLVAGGCSIHEQTQTWYTPADGVSAEAGPVALRNVLVVSDGTDATVLASMVNTGSEDDELVAVTVGEVEVSPAQPVEIPGGGYASVGIGDADARVDVADSGAMPGGMITVEFRFASAPRAEVEAFVRPASGAYADAFDGGTAAEDAADS